MKNQQTRVVVIGAGYAGLLATVRLAGKLRRQPVSITLVNASDVFVERVRLHEFAANQPIKRRLFVDILRGTGVNFVQGYVTHLDPLRNLVTVKTGAETQQIQYDKLLYALGSTIDRDGVPGVREYAYSLTPTGPLSAQELRERLPALNEAGGRLVVVGGGATGIEAAAEFAGVYPNLQVSLITRSSFDQFLGGKIAAYMRKSLQGLGVTIRDTTTVTEVRQGEIATKSGLVAYDLCLWTGGFAVPPLARESGLAANEHGQVLIDPFMRSISHPDILAVGDAAYPVEEPGVKVRMSAFTAVILGAHGADNLSAMLKGQTPKPLSFQYVGQGIALGPRNAVGFGLYPDDRPKGYYFGGRTGYEIRALIVRFLAALPDFERRLPGFFWWMGKSRYAARKRQAPKPTRSAQVDSSL